MEIRKFKVLEGEGKASLKRLTDDLFEVREARFNPEDGTRERVDKATAVMLPGLRDAIGQHEQAILDHQAEVEGIRTMITDMESLNAAAANE